MPRKSGELLNEFERILRSAPWALASAECAHLLQGATRLDALTTGYSCRESYTDIFTAISLESMMVRVLTGKQTSRKGTEKNRGAGDVKFYTLRKTPERFRIRAYLELPGYWRRYGHYGTESCDINENPPPSFRVLRYLFHNGPQTIETLAEASGISRKSFSSTINKLRLIGNRDHSLDRLTLSKIQVAGRGQVLNVYNLTEAEREIWLRFNNPRVRKRWRDFQEHRNRTKFMNWDTVFYK